MQDWRRLGTLVGMVLVAWGVALSTGRHLPYQIAYVLTGLLVGAWLIAWGNLRGWRIERRGGTHKAAVGQWFEEQVVLVNRLWVPRLWLEVKDHSTLPGHRVSQVIPGVKPRARYPWHVRTRLLVRGMFRLGPMTLRSTDPFGLFSFSETLPHDGHILVYPYTVALTFFPLPRGRFSGGQPVRERSLHVTVTVAGVREYQPGDALNRIHWPTTARTGRLMSKEFEMDPLADVWVVLDCHQDVYTGKGWSQEKLEQQATLFAGTQPSPNRFLPPHGMEYAIAAAGSIARHTLARDRSLGLITYAPDRRFVPPDRGERQLHRVLEVLALAEPTARMSLEQILAMELMLFQRNTTVVVITGNWTPRWIPLLLELQRRGVWPVVVLVDGATFGPLPSVRDLLPHLTHYAIPTFVVTRDRPLEEALQKPAWSPVGSGLRLA